jgi:hypothetical protein
VLWAQVLSLPAWFVLCVVVCASSSTACCASLQRVCSTCWSPVPGLHFCLAAVVRRAGARDPDAAVLLPRRSVNDTRVVAASDAGMQLFLLIVSLHHFLLLVLDMLHCCLLLCWLMITTNNRSGRFGALI